MPQDEIKPEGTEGGFDARVGQGEIPPIEPPKEPETPKPVVGGLASISQRLSAQEGGGAKGDVTESNITPRSAMPIDLSQLSMDQRQQLKAMLAETPDASIRKEQKPIIKLRVIDGKIIIDHKRAYLGEVKDVELNRNVERHLIQVKFLGDDEFYPILYKRFIESEQILCEVIKHLTENVPVKEGVTMSRETNTLVEMVRNEVKDIFTVKLPAGSPVETIQIEAHVANG